MAQIRGVVHVQTPELDNLFKAAAARDKCAICGFLSAKRPPCILEELYLSSKRCVLCRVLVEGILTHLLPLPHSKVLYEKNICTSPIVQRQRYSLFPINRPGDDRDSDRDVRWQESDVVWGTVHKSSGANLITGRSMFHKLRELSVWIDSSHGRLKKVRVANRDREILRFGDERRRYGRRCLFGLEFISVSVFFPTRLIHISNDGSIRLCNTAGLHGKYLTLSYCWGKAPGFRTTIANVAERMASIIYEELP
ncbi:hypothetical protein K402DRAFT_400207 [Aulographum hederae CBS 113979]|uniref:Heterokaryon incompatibility domain-containing protein n=1 Tax=Aulographum hederae CBS 113979 TaxID=1176131 RepID=A0A6G1HEM3_9PEZI|nr:hypothetical protein K402DRAFT_400207 [Aulographum hederae CBS 113979]